MIISSSKPESNREEVVLISAIKLQDGNIICGYRHSDCIDIANEYVAQSINRNNCICGFMTSKNRFVSREEAFKIAKRQNQIWHKLHEGVEENILVSEDLY